ncbi:hypothetical protein EV44_g3699 [Erysiphe necator]|uniref:Integrase catalytic domain-containing protein n=1 Tax=Uncinula necator TaxID=52586 RepID=A0A0B1P3H5_UNCNE|nr:hypothetical protein EV44_g3699 [Erysiphe necator]
MLRMIIPVTFNNVTNQVVTSDSLNFPTVRRFGHPFLLWKISPQSLVQESFSFSESYLTEIELRRLHRRFGHPSANRLRSILERSGHDNIDKSKLETLTKFCVYCQKHGSSPGRFRFSLKDDVNFNYTIVIDIMYIEGKEVLHIVDEATRFQAARWLDNVTSKHVWDTLRQCWIDTYVGPPDYILHDAGKTFISREFVQNAAAMSTSTKSVPVEAHWSIGLVERYHQVLRRAYEIICEELKTYTLSKEMRLQMAVKAVNDSAGPNGLVPTLLVFGTYPRMTHIDPPAPSITQRASAIRKAMEEIQQFRSRRLVADALNQRNGPSVASLHNLPLGSNVLVFREGQANRSGKWTGPFELIGIENETCTTQ